MFTKFNMSKLGLTILVFFPSLIVLVESSCSTKYDCNNDECCYLGSCYERSFCDLWKKYESKSCTYSNECLSRCCYQGRCKEKEYTYECTRKYCFDDSDCPDGCCVDSECKPKDSFSCLTKTTSCTSDSDCDGGYCWNNECEQSSNVTINTSNPNACSSSIDCFNDDCCVAGNCVECSTDKEPSTDPYRWRNYFTTIPPSPYDDNDDYDNNDYDNDDYDNNDYDNDDYDNNDYDSHESSSSSGYSAGTIVGITLGGIVLISIKVLYWAAWCNRRRVVLVRCNVRRTACVRAEVTVPIVQHDQLLNEHEQLTCGVPQGLPSGPPPAYSPRAEEDATQNAGQDPNMPQGEGSVNPLYGVPQVAPMGPPPEYSPPIAAGSGENTTQNVGQSPAQTEQALGDGAVNPLYGVPQGATTGLPREYSPPTAPCDNTTPNPTETDLIQLADDTSNPDQTNGVPEATPNCPPPNYS